MAIVAWTGLLLAAGLGMSLYPQRVTGKTPPEITPITARGTDVTDPTSTAALNHRVLAW